MVKKNDKLQELVALETERIKRKRPFVESIDITIDENLKGFVHSKVKAKTKSKTIVLSEEHRCPETSIRTVFDNLTKLLRRKKSKRPSRVSFDLKEAM